MQIKRTLYEAQGSLLFLSMSIYHSRIFEMHACRSDYYNLFAEVYSVNIKTTLSWKSKNIVSKLLPLHYGDSMQCALLRGDLVYKWF